MAFKFGHDKKQANAAQPHSVVGSSLDGVSLLGVLKSRYEEGEGLRALEPLSDMFFRERKFILAELSSRAESKLVIRCGIEGETLHRQIFSKLEIELDNKDIKATVTVKGGGRIFIDYDLKAVVFGGMSTDFGVANPETVATLLIEGLAQSHKGFSIVHLSDEATARIFVEEKGKTIGVIPE